MLRNDMRNANDAQSSMLQDKAAEAWWTYKPSPQVRAMMNPGDLGHGAEGSGRMVPRPAVRASVDPEVQFFGQTSPRSTHKFEDPRDLSPRQFFRKNHCEGRLPPELSGPVVGNASTFGSSLALPSMGSTDRQRMFTTEYSSPGEGASPLGASPHRRGRSTFSEINACDNSGRFAASPPPGSAHNFDDWMSSQSSFNNPSPHRHARTSFGETLHREAQAADPTPFTNGNNPSPRKRGAGAETEASTGRPARHHNGDLWLQQERTNHPRAGPEGSAVATTTGPPMQRPGALWGSERVGRTHDARSDPEAGTRTHYSDLTKGYTCSGGVLSWNEPNPASARSLLTDASYVPPAPGHGINMREPEHRSPSHGRGRSDLQYIDSPRLARAEAHAREREVAERMDVHGNGRRTTMATQPDIDNQRRHKEELMHAPLEEKWGASVGHGQGRTDIHPGAGGREWRMHQRAAARQGAFKPDMDSGMDHWCE